MSNNTMLLKLDNNINIQGTKNERVEKNNNKKSP